MIQDGLFLFEMLNISCESGDECLPKSILESETNEINN